MCVIAVILFTFPTDTRTIDTKQHITMMSSLTPYIYLYRFHTVRKGIHLIGGDTTVGNGLGGYSAFDGKYFPDEGFFIKHSERGILSMANCGKDRNASQFLITLSPQPQLGTCY